MKMNKEVVDNRRKIIMQKIQTNGTVTVDELAQELNVAPMTIRRDLQYWEEKGALVRFYGGARLVQTFVENGEDNNEAYKHAIAKYAAQFIDEGDTVFINTSSTALLMLHYIKNKHVTVITNNAKAVFVDYDPQISVVLSGGELRTPKESMVGDFALNNINRVTADKCFLGCSGFDIEAGMCTAILQEVSINETMIKRCKGPVFMLADATKIGKTHQFNVADISSFHYLITDQRVSEEQLAEFKERKIQTAALNPLNSYSTRNKNQSY